MYTFKEWIREHADLFPDIAATLDDKGWKRLKGLSSQEISAQYVSEQLVRPDLATNIEQAWRQWLREECMWEAFRIDVLAHYQDALDQLAPIMQQLRYTDKLIDAITYRLYGLNEKEIAIIEGRTLPRMLTIRCQYNAGPRTPERMVRQAPDMAREHFYIPPSCYVYTTEHLHI